MKRIIAHKIFAIAGLLLALLPLPSRALIISPTYDASVTGSTNSAQIQSGFNAAIQIIQNLFTNNITINITVYWGNVGPFAGGIGLGASSTSFTGNRSYATLTNALNSLRTTPADFSAVASLPPNDPIATNVWWFPRANAKALGIIVSANDPTRDGSIGFATNVSYTFDPTNRAVAGKYDFIGVALHEITEVMGRVKMNLISQFIPYDLFRFTNSGGHSFDVNATNAYFSVDNGVTPLRLFWTNTSTGDVQDWKPGGAADSFDYSISTGKKGVLSYADITALDVIGYHSSQSLPPPSGTKAIGGSYTLNFTNTPGTTYTLLATTNLSLALTNWPSLGTVTDSVPGVFQFVDAQAATNKFRFYRLKLN